MYDIKEIKTLDTEEAVNQYLEKGWILLKIIREDCFIIGRKN